MEEHAAGRQALVSGIGAPAAYVMRSSLTFSCKVNPQCFSCTTENGQRATDTRGSGKTARAEADASKTATAATSYKGENSAADTATVSGWTGTSLLKKLPLLGRFFKIEETKSLSANGAKGSSSSSVHASANRVSAVNEAAATGASGARRTSLACSPKLRRDARAGGAAAGTGPDPLCFFSSLLSNSHATRWGGQLYMLVWQHTTVYCYVTSLHKSPHTAQHSHLSAPSTYTRLFVYDAADCGWPGHVNQAYIDAEHRLLLIVLTPDSSLFSPRSPPPPRMLDEDGRLTLLLHFYPLPHRCVCDATKEQLCCASVHLSRDGAAPSFFLQNIPFSPFVGRSHSSGGRLGSTGSSQSSTATYTVARHNRELSGGRSSGDGESSLLFASFIPHWLPVAHAVVVPAPVFGVTTALSCPAGLLLFSCRNRTLFRNEKKASVLLLCLPKLQEFFSLRKTKTTANGRNHFLSDASPFLRATSILTSGVQLPPCDGAAVRASAASAGILTTDLSAPHSSFLPASDDKTERKLSKDDNRESSTADPQPQQLSDSSFLQQLPQEDLEELPLSCFTSEHLPALPSSPSACAIDGACQRLLLAGFSLEAQRPWLAVACWRYFRAELDEADYSDPYRSRLCAQYGANRASPTAAVSPTAATPPLAVASPLAAASPTVAEFDISSTPARRAARTGAAQPSSPRSRGRNSASAANTTGAAAAAADVPAAAAAFAAEEIAGQQETERRSCNSAGEEKEEPTLVMLPLLSRLRTAAKVAASLRRLASIETERVSFSFVDSGVQPELPTQRRHQQLSQQNVQQKKQQQFWDVDAAPKIAGGEGDGDEGDATSKETRGIFGMWGASFYRPLDVRKVSELLQQLPLRGELQGRPRGLRVCGADYADSSARGGEAAAGGCGKTTAASALAAASTWLGTHPLDGDEPVEVVHIAVSPSGSRVVLTLSSSEILIMRKNPAYAATAATPTSAIPAVSASGDGSASDAASPSAATYTSGASSVGASAFPAGTSASPASAAAAPLFAAAACSSAASFPVSSSSPTSDIPYIPWLYLPAPYITYLRTGASLDVPGAVGDATAPLGFAAAASSSFSFDEDAADGRTFRLTTTLRCRQEFESLSSVVGAYFERKPTTSGNRSNGGRGGCGVSTAQRLPECEVTRREEETEGTHSKDPPLAEGVLLRAADPAAVAAKLAVGGTARTARPAAGGTTSAAKATARETEGTVDEDKAEEEEEILVLVLGVRGTAKTLQGLQQQMAIPSPSGIKKEAAAALSERKGRVAAASNGGNAGGIAQRLLSSALFSANPSQSVDVCALDLRAAAAAGARAGVAVAGTTAAARRGETRGALKATQTAAEAAAPAARTQATCLLPEHAAEDGSGKGCGEREVLLFNAAAEGGAEQWLCDCVLPDARGAVGLAVLPPQQQLSLSSFDAASSPLERKEGARATLRGEGALTGGRERRRDGLAIRGDEVAAAKEAAVTGIGSASENAHICRQQQQQQQGVVLLTLEQVGVEDSEDAPGAEHAVPGAKAASSSCSVAATDAAAAAFAATHNGEEVAAAEEGARHFAGSGPGGGIAEKKYEEKGWMTTRLCVWEVYIQDAREHVKQLLQQQRFVEAERICCKALTHFSLPGAANEEEASCQPIRLRLYKQQGERQQQQQLQQQGPDKHQEERQQQQQHRGGSPFGAGARGLAVEEYVRLLEAVRAARWERRGSLPEAHDEDFSVSGCIMQQQPAVAWK